MIREHTVPPSLGPPLTAQGPTWEIGGDRFLLRIPGIARFLLTGGRDVGFELAEGATHVDASAFLIGTVFGILLHQRRQVVLHASAVRVGDKAVLFCGASGVGKSTLAAALGQRGYPHFNDDLSAISHADTGTPMVHSEGGWLKLWASAIEGLDLTGGRDERVRRQLEKFYVAPHLAPHLAPHVAPHVGPGASAPGGPLPLGAIYALRDVRPPHAAGIDRPNVADAALLLWRCAYRPLLVRHMGQKPIYFHAAASIANGAGIFHLTRPLDFAHMPRVIAGLEQHWSKLGLMERAA